MMATFYILTSHYAEWPDTSSAVKIQEAVDGPKDYFSSKQLLHFSFA